MGGKRKDGITTITRLKQRCAIARPLDPDCCWIWKGADHERRAAVWLSVGGKGITATAARAAAILTGKEIPAGWRAWSACGNPMCCNPAHARVGTMADFGSWQRETGALCGNAKTIAAQRANGRARSKITMAIAREVRQSALRLEDEAERILTEYGITVSTKLLSAVRRGERLMEPSPFFGLVAVNDARRRAA
jgi:hypothetical protein